MRHALANLLRNVVAGARLAVGLPVSLLSFRIGVGALLALLALDIALDIALGRIAAGANAQFAAWALPNVVLYMAAFLAAAAIIAIALEQPPLFLTIAVVAFAASPVLEIGQLAYRLAAPYIGRSGVGVWIAWGATWAWNLFVLAHVLAIALPRRRWTWMRIASGVVLLAGSALLVQNTFGYREWWYADSDRGFDYSAAVSEQALAQQPQLFATALERIAPQRPGVVDLYFVGFAPYATQDVFRKDVELARHTVESRFDAAGRSIALINHPRTVLDTPLASVTNLRAALARVGERIDADDDVVLVFLTSHGYRNLLAAEFPPLRLDPLTPAALRSMLDDAGIRWRIVVVSACYSGSFIPALADDRTLVLTASASERQSFGCGDDSELTYFTEALFKQALRDEPSWTGAFAKARAAIAERERAEGLSPPSDPQMSLGRAISDKLASLEKRPRAKSP
jgi:hypothetical protein